MHFGVVDREVFDPTSERMDRSAVLLESFVTDRAKVMGQEGTCVAKFRWRRRGASVVSRHRRIATGTPNGNVVASLVIASFAMRIHPWLTSWPSNAGSLVP